MEKKSREFTLRQLFSIIDGRLSTRMQDVYEILNFLTGQSLFTHHLPGAMRWVRSKCPEWYLDAAGEIYKAGLWAKKEAMDSTIDEWDLLMSHPSMDKVYEVEPLDELDMAGFDRFMIENSPLKRMRQ